MTTQTHIAEAESSLAQAYAQLERIKEMVEAHMAGKGYDGYEFASEAIQDDALSVQVRSGWHVPSEVLRFEAAEYEILLCTGGPAVRIVGELNQDGEPVTATLEHQHWFTPWTRVDLRASTVLNAEGVMLTYANQFYFGG